MADYKDNIVSSALAGIVDSADKAMSNTANVGTNTADRGYTNANNTADRGYTNGSNPDAGGQPSGSPGGGYSGYSGGRRSYSSGKPASTKPTAEDQKKQQATGKNLGDIYRRKKGDLEKQTKAGLDVIKDKQKANNALLAQQQRQIKVNSDWQPNQQKEQSTLMALRNRMGNAALGSGIVDLAEGMGRVDDMNDVQLINTYKQNMDNAYNNWFQADTELVGDYNEALADAEQKMGDLMNQYQAALNNVNPLAATTKNINKASKLASASSKKSLAGKKEAYKDAKNVLKQLGIDPNGKKKSYTATKKPGIGTRLDKKAQAISNYDKAKRAYSKAKKAAKGVSVGSGTEKFTLPKVNMNPSSAFSKLMRNKMSNASAVDPLTSEYVRPDRARERLGGRSGIYNTATEANSGFSDNLRAFRR